MDRSYAANAVEGRDQTLEDESYRIVRRSYEMLSRRDLHGFLDCVTEDLVFETQGPPGAPIVGRQVGAHLVVEAIRQNFLLIDLLDCKFFEVVVQGRKVVLAAWQKVRLKKTNIVFENYFVNILTLRDGRICHGQQIVDNGPIVEACKPRLDLN
ncbi:MAG: nuclear transport factor 2 family protein [Planctomycetia bacterium]